MSGNEIKIPDVEQVFSRPDQQHRFPSLCNAVVLAETARPLPTFPDFDDGPGPDGGFDGAWTLPVDDPASAHAAPFALPGWNAFQVKSRGAASNATKAFSQLKNSVRGAVKALIERTGRRGQLRRYILFTNVRLGPPAEATAQEGKRALGRRRIELIAALNDGLPAEENVDVKVFDAAQFQTAINRHVPIRETFFGSRIFQTWNDSWRDLDQQKHGDALRDLVGREATLQEFMKLRARPTVKFIGVSGASGMGKTRLVLEGTRNDQAEVYFVRAKSRFLAADLAAYGSDHPRIFVVEDLRLEHARELAQQVLPCANVCIVATIPAEEHLPRIRLDDSPAIRLVRVKPLEPSDARKLLEAVSPKLDHRAAKWLIQEAGGNPQVLLAAADRGDRLRLNPGEFKAQVAESFLNRAKELFGSEIRAVIEVLSVLSPFDRTSDAHLAVANQFFGSRVTTTDLRHWHERLESAGYVEASGRGGQQLNVSPPLLAAYLVERLLRDHPDRGVALFNGLDMEGRHRLLDRMISVDAAEGLSLWSHLFGPSGPFASDQALEQNIELLRVLARAAPRQTARFMADKANQVAALVNRPQHKLSTSWTKQITDESEKFRENQALEAFRGGVRGVLHELAYHGEGCRDALKAMETLAVAALRKGDGDTFVVLFRECFVYWFTEFPIPLAERWAVILRMLNSPKAPERALGRSVLLTVCDSPHTLSGWNDDRRRMMPTPVPVLWRDIYDYLRPAAHLHLQLARGTGPEAAEAVSRLPAALTQVASILPPAQLMPIFRQAVAGYFSGRIRVSAVDLVTRVVDLQKKFEKLKAESQTADWAAGLPDFSVELNGIASRFFEGPLALRVELWVGRNFGYGLEKDPDTDERRYRLEIAKLGKEIAAAPHTFTPTLRRVVIGEQTAHNFELAQALGKADRGKLLWRRMVTMLAEPGGDWVFPWYCLGVSRHDPDFVNRFLDRQMAPSRRTQSILSLIKIVGPSPENRKRMQQLLRANAFPPLRIAQLFSGGRWLDELPHREVLSVVKYMARDASEICTETILQMVALYMHNKERLPVVLMPVLHTILRRRGTRGQMTDHYRDNVATLVAKASLPAGVKLFRQLLAPHIRATAYMESPGWNPLDNSSSSKDFYTHLHTHAPASTYREVLRYLGSKWRMMRFHRKTALFDLDAHGPLLLRMARQDGKVAEALAGHIMPQQPGFWPVAYALVANARNGTIGDKLIGQCLTQDGMGEYTTHYERAINLFAEQLAQPATVLPDPARAWLTVAKADVEQRLAEARERFQQANDHDLQAHATGSG